MTCNGYKNWETFTVSTELTNNRGLDGLNQARAKIRELEESHEYGFKAAEAFREWFAESAGLPDDPGLSGDYLLSGIICGFLEEVDWREVMADVRGEDDEEGKKQ